MIVHHVDLTEGRPHFANLDYKALWQGCEGNVSLLQIHTFFSKRNEKVSAGVRINNGLQANLRLVHLHGRKWLLLGQGRNSSGTECADKIADDANVRVEGFSGRTAGPAERGSLSLGAGDDSRLSLCRWWRRRRQRLLHGRSGRRGGCRRGALQHAHLTFERNDAFLQILDLLLHSRDVWRARL